MLLPCITRIENGGIDYPSYNVVMSTDKITFLTNW